MFILTFLNIFGWNCGFSILSVSIFRMYQFWIQKIIMAVKILECFTCCIQVSIDKYSWIPFTTMHINSRFKQFNTCYRTDSIFEFCWVISFVQLAYNCISNKSCSSDRFLLFRWFFIGIFLCEKITTFSEWAGYISWEKEPFRLSDHETSVPIDHDVNLETCNISSSLPPSHWWLMWSHTKTTRNRTEYTEWLQGLPVLWLYSDSALTVLLL